MSTPEFIYQVIEENEDCGCEEVIETFFNKHEADKYKEDYWKAFQRKLFDDQHFSAPLHERHKARFYVKEVRIY